MRKGLLRTSRTQPRACLLGRCSIWLLGRGEEQTCSNNPALCSPPCNLCDHRWGGPGVGSRAADLDRKAATQSPWDTEHEIFSLRLPGEYNSLPCSSSAERWARSSCLQGWEQRGALWEAPADASRLLPLPSTSLMRSIWDQSGVDTNI